MTVREAKFVDIPDIVKVMERAHQRSIYAETATFDEQEAKQMLARALQRHGHKNLGGSLVLVSQVNGEIRGFMLSVLDSVYPCLKELVATDLLFIIEKGAGPYDAAIMLKLLMSWAQSNERVIEVRLAVTSAINDHERTAKLYERLPVERCGAIFRRGYDR